MKIGYARVSTLDQNLELQEDSLKQAGCEKIFFDKSSGSKEDRPGATELLSFIRPGDTLIVWKLDRLGRSLKNLVELIEILKEKEVDFVSLQEGFDTSTSGGKLIFHMFGALAEFEKDLIKERTNAGLKAARARGRKGGRKPKLAESKIKTLKRMIDSDQHSVKEICEVMKITKPTYYRYKQIISETASIKSNPEIMKQLKGSEEDSKKGNLVPLDDAF